jgi:phage terminase large subunit|tara:strand:- start:137 stop:1396 length:1260 start_codon:yes stop_codon:yes gene_type:complete
MTQMQYKPPKVFNPLWTENSARYLGSTGGRGSGKSYDMAARAIVRNCKPGTRGLCVREIQKSLRESAHRLLADTIERLGLSSKFDVQSTQIKTPGNGVISFVGMQDHTADSIKSYEGYDWAWVEEAQVLSERSLELLRPTIRKPGSQIWATWNPRSHSDPIEFLRRPDAPENTIVVKANYDSNPYFSNELEQERLHDKINNSDRYAHIWLGEYEPQAIGAIWNRQVIYDNRRDTYPDDLERILVSIDPAVSNTERSDEHGIVVVALDAAGHGYLLEDASCYGSPHQWATRSVAMYDKWEADGVVIEKNQGGDMCRHTLETVRKSLPIIEVHATRGKHIRAEPISALYSVNRISHVGMFPELENQLCLFTSSGWEGDAHKSPDRAEAMIWGFTELFPAMTTEKTKPQEYPNYSEAGGWMG